MVLSISSKQFHGKIFNSRNNKVDKSVNEFQAPPQPDPIMENIQKDTTVEDLGEEQTITGNGFVVKGGKSKPKNNKLRKFVSLNLK